MFTSTYTYEQDELLKLKGGPVPSTVYQKLKRTLQKDVSLGKWQIYTCDSFRSS